MTLLSAIWTTTPFALTNSQPAERTPDHSSASAGGKEAFPTLSGTSKEDNLSAKGSVEESDITSRAASVMNNEKAPLLENTTSTNSVSPPLRQSQVPLVKRIANAIIGAIKMILAAIIAPASYVLAYFYDEQGQFGATLPAKRLARRAFGKRRKSTEPVSDVSSKEETDDEKAPPRLRLARRSSRYNRNLAVAHSPPPSVGSTALNLDRGRRPPLGSDSPSQHTRSKTNLEEVSENGESPTSTRPTRIKIANQDALRRRGSHRVNDPGARPLSARPRLTVDNIKSPTSPLPPTSAPDLVPTPIPPRPLVPRRQPSYTFNTPFSDRHPKTLVLDLDETLIHSMAKGGRMSTGHMVEVKLDSPVSNSGGVIGPQVPILYYVHKRPHCDEFLRKVSKWYNLIVFTASVQEYADPVIDWLELERKYFTARYYRQHCTYRSGAYIKDLSSVEPDLSKVMILDNSPLSYIFHEDNAIPIEGWISDPTDNDLLNLIPLLEALQYTTDVRSLLSLRLGEAT